jgi:hypothetical protein
MLSEAPVHSIAPDEWVRRAEAGRIMGVHVTAVNDAVVKYRIQFQHVTGYPAYYRPDCERAAKQVAQMRAARSTDQAA